MDNKKKGSRVQPKRGRGRAVLWGLILLGAAALLLSTSARLQSSRDKGSSLLWDNLALQKENRETGEALSASQAREEALKQDLADRDAQLAGLKAELEAAAARESGLKVDLATAQGELSDTKQALETTRTELNELTEQCSSILRPTPEALHYQALFPDLYVDAPEHQTASPDKVVYLTFDDGPSAVTDTILKTLDKYDIKATFFVVPNGTAESNRRLKAIADAGHTLAIHTACHEYNTIYASVEAYLTDFELAFRRVEEATGVRCDIFRFPGGSINSYNRHVYQPLIAEMLRRGFTYYDWNASSDDSAGQTTATGIANRAVQTTTARNAILLCHDAPAKTATAKALPTIIEKLQAKGYRFDKMDNTVPTVAFAYR